MATPPPDGLTIRAARPDDVDAAAFAVLLDEAQEGWYRISLGPRAASTIEAAFLESNHALSFEFVTMADLDAATVGMMSAYSGRARGGFGTDPFEAAARASRRHRVLSRFQRRMFAFMDDVPADDFYVRALAVVPTHRGAGIGSALLEAAERLAHESGCRRLALDVYAGNDGGRALYRRFGMVEEAASRRHLGLPNTNVIRMVKPV
ncbi:MAG: GNAT family N-acetyltransferase [Acidimicrobiia bacterium]